MKKSDFISMLESSADEDRAERVAAAKFPPADWIEFASAPKDGTLIDVKFNSATAEPDMAEFYAPGCTRQRKPTEPIIENVAFVNGSFKPVVDGDGARLVESIAGGWGPEKGVGYGIGGVTLTYWRPAAYPFID
jgi:hypothetical protein